MTFHLTCVDIIIIGSVWVADLPPFGKKLLTRVDHMFSLYYDYL